MARLIDAEFIEKYINREDHNTPDERWRPESEFAAMIDNAPTVDAVEAVRCKDCRFNVGNMENDPLDTTDYSDITCSYFMTDGIDADDFCSHGEKMDGGDKE